MSPPDLTPSLSPARQAASLRILKSVAALPGQVAFYALSLLAVAGLGGVELPAALSALAMSLGVNSLAGMLQRLAEGDDLSEDDIRRTVQEAIAETRIAERLTNNEFQRGLGRIIRQMDILRFTMQAGEYNLAAQLAAQSDTYGGLLTELRVQLGEVLQQLHTRVATRQQGEIIVARLDRLDTRLQVLAAGDDRAAPPSPLPPDLFAELVQLCEPCFKTEADREARLQPVLNSWPDIHEIDWSRSARVFTTRLVRRLSAEQIKATLRALIATDNLDPARVEGLCDRIDAAHAQAVAAPDTHLRAYHQHCVQTWSAARYQLDRRFVQLTLLIDQGPEATQGPRFAPDPQRARYDDLGRLLADIDDRAAVLLGKPGSGKTTLLRRLQLEHAWAALAGSAAPLTFFVSLNGYRAAQPGDPLPAPRDWLAQEWRARYPDLPDFETLFQAGRLLLLLDGLNEISHRDPADYQERVARWRLFLQQMPIGNRAVLSCRTLDYSAPLSSEGVVVRQVQVEPLSEGQIEQFLTLYLAERAAPVWAALQGQPHLLELFATPFFLQLLVEQVDADGRLPAGRAALLTGFVRRALRRELERAPRRLLAGSLLSDDDRRQVVQQLWGGAYDLPEEGPLIPQLAALAYGLQAGRQTGEAGQVRAPVRTAQALLDAALGADILAAGCDLSILDKDIIRREIAFYHQLVQEYFAARALARRPEPNRVTSLWRADAVKPSLAETLAALAVSDPLPGLPTSGWEETTVLAAALADDPAAFVAGVAAANLPLAGRCAAAPEVNAKLPPDQIADVQQALIARMQDPAADLRARIAAAEALGELGDPRFARRSGPHGAYLLPPMATIPAGAYPIGDDKSQYDDEKPAHMVTLAAFELGVFSVTNAEYALFLRAGGYDDERWWQTEAARAWRRGAGNEGVKQAAFGQQAYLKDFSEDVIRRQQVSPEQIDFWLWLRNASTQEIKRQYDEWYPSGQVNRQPRYWDDSAFNHPARPLVGVCWFEARAYCAWLSAQTGDAYDLPTEVEWEAAARGAGEHVWWRPNAYRGRVYAYGSRFDAAYGNTFETHIRRTTPVGVFPGGDTPEGIADLSGNVWEWTTTLWGDDWQRPQFRYPYVATDGREDLTPAAALRILRGGSWDFTHDGARAACRVGYGPGYRGADGGFRVRRRPPSHPL